ncbi:hypothetical protein VTL71DRAFT_9265 [Oculimacula yallundae]|uniref:YjgF-like protein n=1 Tax=Oculimacula yallundae TaxID=86028 RepID=A0ABR4BSL2_9HELO
MSSSPAPPESHITFINPQSGPYTRPTYSHIASVSLTPSTQLIYTAGQVGTFSDRSTAPTFALQATQAFANLKTALEAAGAGVRDIVKLTYYIVDVEKNLEAFRGAYKEFLMDGRGLMGDEGMHRPPATVVGVAALAKREWLVEVEAVAAVKGTESKL